VPATARILHLQAAPGSDKLRSDGDAQDRGVFMEREWVEVLAWNAREWEWGNTRWRSRVVL
jgi:hypothetical protein